MVLYFLRMQKIARTEVRRLESRLMERESSDVVIAAEAWLPRWSRREQILKPPNRIDTRH